MLPCMSYVEKMKTFLAVIGWLIASGTIAQSSNAPVVQVSVTEVSCAGKTDGQLEMTLLAGSQPVSFQWLNMNTGSTGMGQFTGFNQSQVLSGVPAGMYRLLFTGADGADTTFQRLLLEPPPLKGTISALKHYGAFQLRCAGDKDGEILLSITGGTIPLSFLWSNGDLGILADSLGPGPVSVTVTDARGCLLEVDTVLEAPPPITTAVEVEGETCLGQNSGRISLESVSGGIPPYKFALSSDPPGSKMEWTDLPYGVYFVHVTDAAGCSHTHGVILPSGLAFTVKLGADTTILSGDTLLLNLQIDPPADTLIWQPAQGVQMLSDTLVMLTPLLSTTYRVTAMNADGCMATDEIRITVNRDRQTYAPNVFAPRAQSAENRSFTLYGSPGIRAVALLQVYDRFGRQWFENRNFPVNDPNSGWNGADGNEEAPAGVYLWRALLQYTDGREELLQGDVTVIR